MVARAPSCPRDWGFWIWDSLAIARQIPTIESRIPADRTSAAIAAVVSASSSGSVIGVDCRYSMFGFNANTAAAATAAAADSVSVSTIDATEPVAIANARIDIATADAPVR